MAISSIFTVIIFNIIILYLIYYILA